MRRFGMFGCVGLIGFAVQTLLLAVATRRGGWHYGVAAPVTAEIAVLGSFAWHSVWTWADRPAGGLRPMTIRLLRYQIVKGVAIFSSYLLMLTLVGGAHLAPEAANALAVAAVSLSSFELSDRLVFPTS